MKESYAEGLATHSGSESCGGLGKGSVEALTGVRAGRVLSRERRSLRDADAVGRSGRHHRPIAIARCVWVPRGLRPRARTETPGTRTGRSWVRPPPMEWRAVSGRPRTQADDERAQEVGQSYSTCEVPEQCRASGGGGDGGKRLSWKSSRLECGGRVAHQVHRPWERGQYPACGLVDNAASSTSGVFQA
jgi:hypothetical protein